jgi:hypothetical protein
MTYPCNPSYLRGIERKITVGAQTGWKKKLVRAYLKEYTKYGGSHQNPSYMGGIGRKIVA